MSYKKRIQILQDEIILGIKQFLASKGIKELQFKNSFAIYVTEGFGEDVNRVMYGAVAMRDESIVAESSIDEQEVTLIELDIYELAHILDLLETNQFEISETVNQ